MALDVPASENASFPINLSKNKDFSLFQDENLSPYYQKAETFSVNETSRKRNLSSVQQPNLEVTPKQTASQQMFASSKHKQQQVNLLLICHTKSIFILFFYLQINQDSQIVALDLRNQNEQSLFKVPSGLPPKKKIKTVFCSDQLRKTGNNASKKFPKLKKQASCINRVDVHYTKTSRRPKQSAKTMTPGSLQSQRRPPGYDMYLLPEPKNDSLSDLINSMTNNPTAVKRNFSHWLKGELQFLVPQSTYLEQLQSLPDNVFLWTVVQVRIFISAVGFSEIAESLEALGVDGPGLLMLKQCDLMDIVGLQPLPAAHLFGFILRLHGDLAKILGMDQSNVGSTSTKWTQELTYSSNSSHHTTCISENFKKMKIDAS